MLESPQMRRSMLASQESSVTEQPYNFYRNEPVGKTNMERQASLLVGRMRDYNLRKKT